MESLTTQETWNNNDVSAVPAPQTKRARVVDEEHSSARAHRVGRSPRFNFSLNSEKTTLVVYAFDTNRNKSQFVTSNLCIFCDAREHREFQRTLRGSDTGRDGAGGGTRSDARNSFSWRVPRERQTGEGCAIALALKSDSPQGSIARGTPLFTRVSALQQKPTDRTVTPHLQTEDRTVTLTFDLQVSLPRTATSGKTTFQ